MSKETTQIGCFCQLALYVLPLLWCKQAKKFFNFLSTFSREHEGRNMTIIVPTKMRLNDNYQLYYISWFRAMVTAFIPFILLLILNGKIIYQMRKTKTLIINRVNWIVFDPAPAYNNWSFAPFFQNCTSSQKREAKLARTLVAIVFFFLFCNVGKLFVNIFDLGNLGKIEQCHSEDLIFKSPSWVIVAISLNHLLLVMNASANLILIGITGTQFRATLFAMLRLTSRRRPPSLSNEAAQRLNGSPRGNVSCQTSGRDGFTMSVFE